MALTIPISTSVASYNYSRDDLFDTLTVNNTTFAIFQKPLRSDQSQNLTLAANCHCVFLAPIEAENDIIINAVNILALCSFYAKTGATHIHAENFYGLGIESKGDVFIQTNRDLIVSSGVNNLHVEFGGTLYLGLTEQISIIAKKIKALYVQGINETNVMPFAQALLKATQILNDPTGEKAILSESLQPLLLKDI